MPRVRANPSIRPDPPAQNSAPGSDWIAVAALTLLAAILRLVWLDRSPPGLNQDEAINAWNAYSLLKTGADMVGVHWPLFYFSSIADNRTPLFIYWLIPFLALGGLNVVSLRVAPALSGILCIPLAYWVGARLFGRRAGLAAAAFLAVNPWHLTSTRWAIDGSIVPFIALATLATCLWANLPIADGEERSPRPFAAAVAGAVTGLGAFGYWAIRIHLPVLLVLALLFTWRGWRDLLRSRRGVLALVAFVLGLSVTFGSLAVRHFTDPAVSVRGSMTRLWEPGTPAPEIARRVLERYAIHFAPEFLFVRGDQDPGNSPAGSGAFEWVMLPLFAIGAAFAAWRFRRSRSHALLIAMVLAYPAGDVLARYPGVHAFRSSPGMIALVLLAASGAACAWDWLRARSRALAWVAAVALAGAMLVQDAFTLASYFGPWRERAPVYRALFHADFMQACEWVRPRFEKVDAVFWTARGVNMPFAMTLVGLNYDPAKWASDPKDVRRNEDGWDYYVRYGKNYFLYGQAVRPYVDQMKASGRRVHALFVVRPGELGLKGPVHVVRGPRGEELLWICEGDL